MRRSLFAVLLVVVSAASACDSSGPAAPSSPDGLPGLVAAPLQGDANDPFLVTAPVTAPARTLAANASHHYRVTVPAGHDGLRVGLACAQSCSVYLRHGAATSSVLTSSTSATLHTLFRTNAETTADDLWFVEVHMNATAGDYTLRVDDRYSRPLAWDAGAAAVGATLATAPDTVGGEYLYTMTTQLGSYGAWRTVLLVDQGEAHLYTTQGASYPPPYTGTKSEKVGSDAVVLAQYEFSANQTWTLRVHAEPGASWRLFTGDVYVKDLGTLKADATSSGTLTIGPEGCAWAKTTVPGGALAWRLAAPTGATLYVNDTTAPVPGKGSSWDLTRPGQLLVVPDYLTSSQYLVAVSGPPGAAYLDSRLQQVRVPSAEPNHTGGDFSFTLSATDDAGFGYLTYRVDVPLDQIAWQVTADPTLGDVDVYVRRGKVPAEYDNSGMSEVVGDVADSIVQVPPTLTDGPWYVTVHGAPPFSLQLTSGNPEITDIAYVNDPTPVSNGVAHEGQAGWRYFRVRDITAQTGTLGWILELENQVPGTEIAVRRNGVPGRWYYRQDRQGYDSTGQQIDASGTSGFLERPNHAPDVWYVGVLQRDQALGPFKLRTKEVAPVDLDMNAGDLAVTNQPSGRWRWFKTNVPPSALGWDLSLTNITSGMPRLVFRQDLIPGDFQTSPTSAYQLTSWQSGNQWAPYNELTARPYAPYVSGQNSLLEAGRHVQMGLGSPINQGVYYVGVSDLYQTPTGTPLTYRLRSRGIGQGNAPSGAPWSLQVQDLPLVGGSATVTNLAPREAAYYKVAIPAGQQSYAATVETTSGDAMMALRYGVLPNSEASSYYYTSDATSALAVRRQKAGGEYFYKYPPSSQTSIAAGTLYLAVAAEGQAPYSSSYIGTGTSTFTVRSIGPLPVAGGADVDLGTEAPLVFEAQSLKFGEHKAYRFNVPAGVSSMELRLKNATGRPYVQLSQGTVPFPTVVQSYAASEGGGAVVGQGDATQTVTITAPTGVYTVLVTTQTSTQGLEVDATYDLEIVARGEGTLDFNNGLAAVVAQAPQTWRFFKVVVPAEATGWDLRLANVQSGSPRLAVRRDSLPDSLQTTCCSLYDRTAWLTGEFWAPTSDLTGRPYAPYVAGQPSVYEPGRAVQMGMGAPLSPGTYYVGVIDSTSSATGLAMTYELVSRGIGQGNAPGGQPWAIQIQDLGLEASADVVSLPAREVAYYKVVIPANTTSFEMEVEPTSGEAMFAIAKGHLPSSAAGSAYYATTESAVAGVRRQKAGTDFFYAYPTYTQQVIPAGTYYIAAASEGQSPYSSSYIGTGAASFTVRTKGQVDVATAAAPLGSGVPIVWTGQSLRYGEHKAYRLTVPAGTTSMEVKLTNTTGRPYVTLIKDGPFPAPSESYKASQDGWSPSASTDTIVTVAQPAGTWTAVVTGYQTSQGGEVPATFDLSFTALSDEVVAFNGGEATVTAQPTRTWRYFRVTVPSGALGWDLRLVGVTAGAPKMVVRRDLLPDSLQTTCCSFTSKTSWASGEQWYPAADITGRPYAPYVQGQSSVYEPGRVLVAGMGAPLSPGQYVVGVIDDLNSPGAAMTYTLRSRGIGQGDDASATPWAIQVVDVPWDGGTHAFENVAPREAAYVHVHVPEAVEGLGFELHPTDGEAMMSVKKGQLPNSEPYANGDGEAANSGQAVRRQKAGDEFHYSFMRYNETAVAAGDWYFALASEGHDPYSSSYIGTGTSSFVFKSVGRMVPAGGVDQVVAPGQPLRFDGQALRYGENRVYRFRVTPEVPAFEVRLANRVGGPSFALQLKPYFTPTLPSATSQSYVATVGGQGSLAYDDVATTIVGQNGDVSVLVYANRDAQYLESNAQFDLVVTPRVIDPLQWRGGTANVTVATKETKFFQLDVPNDCDGVPLAGWLVTAENTSGTYTISARKDYLPGDPNGQTTFQAYASQVVVAPPFFGPGRWYVAVTGTNLSTLTLRSEEISELQHWDMPLRGATPSTPGVPAPYFADSGVLPDGTPFNEGDRGRDLGQGRHHFYRVTVPPGNGGLLATYLEALSGNPDVYIRRGAAPTRNHGTSGYGGTIYDYSDTEANTTYGHLVPVSARNGWALDPGEWWIAVYAPNSNVRYRLKLSVGDLQDLSFSGGLVNDASLAAGDMRHYRVTVPQSSTTLAQSVPTTWNLRLLQEQGDVVVFVREIVPSGQTTQNFAPSSFSTYYWSDWTDDRSDVWGGSSLPAPVLDNSGTTTLSVPALMPGTEYIVSVYAKTQTVYDLESTPGPNNLALDGVLAWKGGTVDTTLPAGAKRLYRIDFPADGARLLTDATTGPNVWVNLQLGTVPPGTTSADRSNYGSASSGDWDLALYSSSTYYQYNYPWMPGRSYYLAIENRDAAAQPVKLVLDGRDRTDDSDADGLPDWWEYDNFSSLYNTASQDYDSDDLTNLVEYQRGSSPTRTDTDADGLWDGLEVLLGADPLDPNSDGDLACDGDDSAPTDPDDYGEVIRLTMHRYTEGQYGNGFGTNRHQKTLRAVFAKTSSAKAHWIHAKAWGIDAADEVAVFVNGKSVGALPVGGAAGSSQPVMFWIDTNDLKTGDNFVELRRAAAGDAWGVEDLGLFTFGDPFGKDSTRAYDTRHPDGVTLIWPKPAAGVLELRGFDVDSEGEVAALLDGKRWLELPGGADLAWTRYWEVPIGASDLAAGAHTIDLRRAGGDGDWQIRLVDFRTPTTQTLGIYSSTENSHASQSVGFLFPTTPADRELKVRYQAWPARSTVALTGTNVYAYPPALPEEQYTSNTEILLCSRADVVDWARFAFQSGDPTSPYPSWNVQMTYWGVPLDSDSDGYDDCADRFPRDKDEWYDADGDRLGDNWEIKYFGTVDVSDGTVDTDLDGTLDAGEFVVRTDPVCADNDHDSFPGRTDLCLTGTDCDDQDPTAGANTNDKDCDGVATAVDCDDDSAAVTYTSTNDKDCDRVATGLDCDDQDPLITTTSAGDADCDGVPTAIDCNDASAAVTASNVDDADCDGVPTATDCDDASAAVTNTRTSDADCDRVPTAVDCDDSDPAETRSSANDKDCDGVPTATDCDDGDASVTATNVGDADCDGVPTATDCDDGDAGVTATNVGDADCDGVPTVSDCDDGDAAVATTSTDDKDCDGVPTATDCDDGDAAVTTTNVGDADCDGVPTATDCNDASAAVTATNVGDADCDGVPTATDCDDGSAGVATIRDANDLDCDGLPTPIDCDDGDVSDQRSRVDDADCDGVGNRLDCDDQDAQVTRTNAGDADCDLVGTDVDCDDHDPGDTRSKVGDADCDGAPTASDCDDHDATVQACPVCVDLDEDGHDAATATCKAGDDCDDADKQSTWRAVDADCDGARTADDCDDDDAEAPVVADDADCDWVPTADDCDDADPALGARAEDGDCDGALDEDDNCPTLANADQADADLDGTGDACETCVGPDGDGDLAVDVCDVCPTVADDQRDGDHDGVGDACEDGDGDGLYDPNDNCPEAGNADQLDSDHDGVGDACDTVVDVKAKEDSGCGTGAALPALALAAAGLVALRVRRRRV